MKRACLLIVVPALLVALGFAQTPTASSNTDSTSIKGCLGGADSNYTLVEDNTGRNFKITTSSVDLKPHLGHDVTVIGQKATTGAADGSFAVTSVNMISEHCAAAAPAGSISTPADTAISPPAAAAVPAATIPAPTDTTNAPAAASAVPAAIVATPPELAVTPAVAAAAPGATVPPAAETASAPTAAAPSTTSPAEPVVTPNVAVPAAAATVQTPADTASAPAAPTTTLDTAAPTDAVVVPKSATAHRTRMPADHERAKATAAATAPPAETATPVADAAKPFAADNAPSETAVTPDAAVATPAVTTKKGAPGLWIAMAVVVLILGTLVPLINRWRKRRLLAQSGKQNLSFSHRASSEPGNRDKPVTRKAA